MNFSKAYLYLLKIAGILFVGLIAYVLFFNAEDFLNPQVNAKKVEMHNIVLTGYQKGVLSWLMKGKYVWSSYNLDQPLVEHIYDGQLYDNGRVVLRQFSARKVNVNVPQERLFAEQGVRAVLIRQADQQQQPVEVWAEQLQYFSQEKKSFIQQKVKVRDQKNNLDIEASSAKIDHSENIITFSRDFQLFTKNSEVTGVALVANINRELCVIEQASVVKKAEEDFPEELRRQETKLASDKLQVESVSENTMMTMSGNVLIRQPDKQGFGDRAVYNEDEAKVVLSGSAGIVFDKSDWLLDRQTVDKIKNQEAKSMVYEKLTMRGDELIIDTRTKDLQAQGQVTVVLNNKAASSEQAAYDSKKEIIDMTGEVKLRKSDGSWVSADRVSVEVKTEKFIADGKVESTVILKR